MGVAVHLHGRAPCLLRAFGPGMLKHDGVLDLPACHGCWGGSVGEWSWGGQWVLVAELGCWFVGWVECEAWGGGAQRAKSESTSSVSNRSLYSDHEHVPQPCTFN